MPIYTFSCNSCHKDYEKFLSIPEFIEAKSNIIKCEHCTSGTISHKVLGVNSAVERTNEEIIMDIQEDIRKTVNKLGNGDLRVFEDIYGDRVNPYKN